MLLYSSLCFKILTIILSSKYLSCHNTSNRISHFPTRHHTPHSFSTLATTFNSVTGIEQSFTIPTGAVSMSVDMYGARGGNYGVANGGKGARVQATFLVTAGTTYYYNIGGRGSDTNAGETPGGFNGGGASGVNGCSGGGATDLRTLSSSPSSRIMVAAGGGGANFGCASLTAQHGGAGGQSGGIGGLPAAQYGGLGATQSAVGAAGCYGGSCGAAGVGSVGGAGVWGAGGGGGWFGGG